MTDPEFSRGGENYPPELLAAYEALRAVRARLEGAKLEYEAAKIEIAQAWSGKIGATVAFNGVASGRVFPNNLKFIANLYVLGDKGEEAMVFGGSKLADIVKDCLVLELSEQDVLDNFGNEDYFKSGDMLAVKVDTIEIPTPVTTQLESLSAKTV